jgi:hypothetical protein
MDLPLLMTKSGVLDPRFPLPGLGPNVFVPPPQFVAAEEWNATLSPDQDFTGAKYGDVMTRFRVEGATLMLVVDGQEVGEIAEHSVLPLWSLPMRSIQLRVRTNQPNVLVTALNVWMRGRELRELETAPLHCGFSSFVVHDGYLDFA